MRAEARDAAAVPSVFVGFAWCVLLFPLSVLLHELAHVLAGRLGGFAMILHHASATGLPEVPPWAGRPGAVALAALAGPLVTLALAGLGAINARRAWGMPLVAAAIPRFFANLVYLVQLLLALFGAGTPASADFDESVAAAALGWPPLALEAPGGLLFVVVLLWLGQRAGGGGFLALLLGTGLGMALWYGWAGPMLLP